MTRSGPSDRVSQNPVGTRIHAKGGCGISVGHTEYTNASSLRVLGVHGLDRNRETIWKWSTHICFDGH